MNRSRRKLNFDIGIKMILFQIILLAVPVIVMGWISYDTSMKETTALIEKDLRHSVEMAVQMAVQMNQSVEDGQMTLDEAQERMKEFLLGPLQADGSRPINRDIDLGENGYFFVLNQEGTLLAHPLMEGENIWDRQSSDGVYYIQDMIRKGQEGGGFTYYNWPLPDNSAEAPKVSYSKLMPEWGWIFAGGSYFQDYNAGQRKIEQTMWLTLILCIAIGTVLIYAFSRHIARPISRIADYSRIIAEGNLSVDPPALKRKDELGRLADHFGVMTRALRTLIGNAKNMANQVGESAEKLTAAVNETTNATRQITASIESLSAGLDTQATSTQESARVVEEMALGVGQIAESSGEAFELSEEMSRHAVRGEDMLRQSIRQMESVRSAFGELTAVLSQLDRDSQRIEEFSGIIGAIAEQTHLLALNASIEAARAGEYGRGFAVVAAEVRKLADQSIGAAQQIAGLVQASKDMFARTGEVVERSGREIAGGVDIIAETGRVFEDILESSRKVLEKVTEVSSTAQELSAGTQEVAATIGHIAQIASESSGSAQEVAAAAEEQLAMTSEVNDQANALREQARLLMEQAGKFKV